MYCFIYYSTFRKYYDKPRMKTERRYEVVPKEIQDMLRDSSLVVKTDV